MKRFASMYNRVFDTEIVVNGNRYNCWIANTEITRRLGLMGCKLQPKQGCLIDFDKDINFSLWMKDCLHPLVAVFVNGKGVVVGKALMSHKSPYQSHSVPAPCRYALELLTEDAENINVGDEVYIEVDDD